VYELTPQGRTALEGWLASSAETLYELRDEGMLKLFFSGSLPDQRIENLLRMRASMERKLEQLRAIEPHAAEGPPGPRLTLDLGITITQCVIGWCEQAERRLAEGGPAA
jgi:hypothetical protein